MVVVVVMVVVIKPDGWAGRLLLQWGKANVAVALPLVVVRHSRPKAPGHDEHTRIASPLQLSACRCVVCRGEMGWMRKETQRE